MDHPTQPNPAEEGRKPRNLLKYAFDGRFLPKTPPDDDTSKTTESNHTISETRDSSESEYSARSRVVTIATSFQIISNTMLRMELAELEMMKKRESARLEAQRRQSELENEMTQMMLQTQSHIASLISRNSSGRKRKSSSLDDELSTSGTNMY